MYLSPQQGQHGSALSIPWPFWAAHNKSPEEPGASKAEDLKGARPASSCALLIHVLLTWDHGCLQHETLTPSTGGQITWTAKSLRTGSVFSLQYDFGTSHNGVHAVHAEYMMLKKMSLRCAPSFSNIPSYIVRHVFGVEDALDQKVYVCV